MANFSYDYSVFYHADNLLRGCENAARKAARAAELRRDPVHASDERARANAYRRLRCWVSRFTERPTK